MRGEHRDAPWFVTPAQTPATESAVTVTTTETTNEPPPFASFTVPLPPPAPAIPHQEESVSDTLPFVSKEEDSAAPELTSASKEWVFTPEDVKEDIEWDAQRATRWELSKDKMKEYMVFASSV